MKTTEDVANRIAAIPTRLGLTSECDRELIYTAANKLVTEYKDAILDFIDRRR